MGCDGGSFTYRSEMVKLKPKLRTTCDGMTIGEDVKLVASPTELRTAKWSTCALSKQPLNLNFESDTITGQLIAIANGRMIDKEALISALIENKTKVKATLGISSLKETFPLKLYRISSSAENISSNERRDYQNFSVGCPITGKPMNGIFRFVFNAACGCVISEQALKETDMDKNHSDHSDAMCLVCDCKVLRYMVLYADGEEAKEQVAWAKRHFATKRPPPGIILS